MSENVYEFSDRNSIEEQARRWLIRLDGDPPLSDGDAAALREWLARSPAHRKELQRISLFWNRANVLTELAIPLHPLIDNKAQWFARIATAFVLVLAVALVPWLMQSPERGSNGVYGTVVGQEQTLRLADGSTLQLNTDSQVQVDYSKALRKIRLLRGEVHFEVAREPDRPFEVYARSGLVRAVGTAFSVYLKDEEVQVTVTEGQVDIATINMTAQAQGTKTPAVVPGARKLGTLKSGQTTTFSENISEISEVSVAELERRQSWRQGVLIFRGEPLSDVVREVNRYTPMTIEIADPALNSLKVGGRFEVGEFEAMFEVLEQSFGIEIARLSDQRIQLWLPGNR